LEEEIHGRMKDSLGSFNNYLGKSRKGTRVETALTRRTGVQKIYLKSKSLGMAAVQKARAHQHSRLTWIRKEDTNTRFFQLHANMRKKKSFIATLNG
jgi:hypothetical protein